MTRRIDGATHQFDPQDESPLVASDSPGPAPLLQRGRAVSDSPFPKHLRGERRRRVVEDSPSTQPASATEQRQGSDIEPTTTQSETGESPPRGTAQRWAVRIATVGPAGYGPVAPGTWGSAVALVLFAPLSLLSLPSYLTAAAAVTLAGTWAADRAERGFGRKDDGRIVIDEVAGQLVTLAPLVPLREALSAVPMPIFSLFFWLAVTGFVAFRVLDVWKPGPVRWAQDHFSGGLGVMADDVLAGVLGAALMAVVAVGALGLLAPGAGG